MTPMEKHQSQVAARVLEELKKRSMEGYYCRTAQEAADLVSSLIADGGDGNLRRLHDDWRNRHSRCPEKENGSDDSGPRRGKIPGGSAENLPPGFLLRHLPHERQRHYQGRTTGQHRRKRQPGGSSVFRPEAGAGHRRHEQSQRDFRGGRQPGQKHRCPCQLSAAEQGDSLCQDRRVRQLPVPRLHLLPDRHYPPLLSRRTDQGHPDRGQLGLLKLYPGLCATNVLHNEYDQEYRIFWRNLWKKQIATQEDFAKTYDVPKVYDQIDDVFTDPDVDVIYISTPHNTHIGYLRKALKKRKACTL